MTDFSNRSGADFKADEAESVKMLWAATKTLDDNTQLLKHRCGINDAAP
jgi:hypothetical protein